MKKTITFLLASAAGLAVATPAMAQDDPFTGIRAQAIAGFDSSRAGSDTDDEVNEDNDQSIEGLLYGVGVGYDFAAGDSVTVGVEAELSDSTASTQFSDGGDFEGLGFGGRLDTGRDIYVGGRIGFRAGDNALVYAKGGYTNATYNLLAEDFETELETDIDLDGWRAGAGVEYALSNNMFINAEYRYSNYNEGELDFDGTDGDRFDIDLDRHQVLLGLGVRF